MVRKCLRRETNTRLPWRVAESKLSIEPVRILNDGDDLHVRATLGTHERIDFVHLRKKPCPGALPRVNVNFFFPAGQCGGFA